MLISSDRAAYSSACLKAQGLAVFHTDSPPFSPAHTMCAGLQFSNLVSICGQKWPIFVCLNPDPGHSFCFVLFCFLTWTVCCPCTSSFRRSRSRALQPAGEAPVCSGLKQLLIRGAILGTLPFFSPPAYATGPLPGGIFSGTPPPSALLSTYHMRRIYSLLDSHSAWWTGSECHSGPTFSPLQLVPCCTSRVVS